MNSKTKWEEMASSGETVTKPIHGNAGENGNIASRYDVEEIFASEESGLWKMINSPIHISLSGEKWWIVIGNYRLSEGLNSVEEAYADAKRTDMDRFVQIIDVIYKINKQENE